jgi:hypothetical protein
MQTTVTSSLANADVNDSFMIADDSDLQSQPHPNPSSPHHAGRPKRDIWLPRRYWDIQPEPSAPLPPPVPEPPQPTIRRVILHVRDSIRTAANAFGLLREYMYRPSYDPDAHVSPEDLVNPAVFAQSGNPENTGEQPSPPWPFANMSIFRLMNWMNSGSTQKSEGEVKRLVENVLCAPDFRVGDLAGFKIGRENKRLDKATH